MVRTLELTARRAVVIPWLGVVAILVTVPPARAQEPPAQNPPGVIQEEDGTLRLRLPVVTVRAEKEPENVQDAPVSVTAVTRETLTSAGVRSVSEAAQYAPNVYFTEFTARKLSNARFRGISSQNPNSPGVTTFIDGVPQLHANSSSIELVDTEQIEFVRGPQSALFGRNTLGGLVNITSRRPSQAKWTAELGVPYGNYTSTGLQGSASGPLGPRVAFGVGAGYATRDGFTTNSVTGHDLDSRSAVFSKTQVQWTPAAAWDVRGIVTTERARDGDYGLNDLAALRAAPFRSGRDFEGFTHRDLAAETILVSHAGKTIDFSSTTGLVWWKTDDLTDLDYTPQTLIRRANTEDDRQFTQEIRVASAANASRAWNGMTVKWQAGLFFFKQAYTQDAVNSYSPFVLSQSLSFPIDQHSPQSALDDHGVGVYGRGTLTFKRKLDVVIGARVDHENKAAALNTFYSPAIAAAAVVQAEQSFNDASPQFTVSYHVRSDNTLYATAARGFKAGGFNAASPTGKEAYGQEHTWNYEGGVKTSWLAQRLSLNAAVFFIDWTDLQVNVSNPQVAGQFYIANAGTATSKGVEVELSARARPGLDLFGSIGSTNAQFGGASVSGGANVSGKTLANTPDMTGNVGLQYARRIRSTITAYGRAELTTYGKFFYDDANTESQSAYSLATFRGGMRGSRVFVEGWVRNAFDAHYIPTALAFSGLAPSGFIGENGAPRTAGVRAGVTF